MKAITNIDGNFQIDGLDKEKTYTLYINYIGYKTQKIDGVQAKDADQVIALQPDEQQLKEVTVTAVERRNTDAAMIQVAKSSPVIVSNVSAQEISRTQDTNAGEVILDPDLLVGSYREYRSLEYQTRNFINSVALG